MNQPNPQAGAPTASWYSQVILALLSSVLLDLCFPLAGPMPAWQGAIAWIALVPLLFATLRPRAFAQRRYLRNAAFIGYLSGIAWYVLNSYWIYRTMNYYAGVPPWGAAGILVLYSLVLGLYFGLFAWGLALIHKRLGLIPALCLAPILWPAVEILAYHLTRVPWDQLGYAQVDNFWLARIAPWAGTYGIATVIVIGNILFTAALLRMGWPTQAIRWLEWGRISSKLPTITAKLSLGWLAAAILFCGILQIGSWTPPPPAPTSATALLLQVDLGTQNIPRTPGFTWQGDMERFSAASQQDCRPYLPGIPHLVHNEIHPDCTAASSLDPDLIVWPEAPSPWIDEDPSFRAAMASLAQKTHAGIIAGDIAQQYFLRNGKPASATYNSASVFAPSGKYIGRYDKIHLVPFGEYVPYQRYFSWAGALVDQIGTFTHGWRYLTFPIQNHRYGIFICYESIFSNQVRIFAKNGAQVFVNISDDAWYGNTSAPWQHLNMARMRAIENHRWILLDTNNGITSAIDPEGRVTQSVPRNKFTALLARYGFESNLTFYTEYGDIYAFTCAAIALAAIALAITRRRKST
ncbi:MAG: apolipoprotein N-acyltransferase [Acidobacteriaceae bacterium]